MEQENKYCIMDDTGDRLDLTDKMTDEMKEEDAKIEQAIIKKYSSMFTA